MSYVARYHAMGVGNHNLQVFKSPVKIRRMGNTEEIIEKFDLCTEDTKHEFVGQNYAYEVADGVWHLVNDGEGHYGEMIMTDMVVMDIDHLNASSEFFEENRELLISVVRDMHEKAVSDIENVLLGSRYLENRGRVYASFMGLNYRDDADVSGTCTYLDKTVSVLELIDGKTYFSSTELARLLFGDDFADDVSTCIRKDWNKVTEEDTLSGVIKTAVPFVNSKEIVYTNYAIRRVPNSGAVPSNEGTSTYTIEVTLTRKGCDYINRSSYIGDVYGGEILVIEQILDFVFRDVIKSHRVRLTERSVHGNLKHNPVMEWHAKDVIVEELGISSIEFHLGTGDCADSGLLSKLLEVFGVRSNRLRFQYFTRDIEVFQDAMDIIKKHKPS